MLEGNWRYMGKYQIIYADPPWSYDDKALNRGGAERHYSTMKLEDICALPVAEIAADDALLFMWGAWPKLFEAKAVIEAWGFEFKTCAFVWVKTNKRTNPDQASFSRQRALTVFGAWVGGRERTRNFAFWQREESQSAKAPGYTRLFTRR